MLFVLFLVLFLAAVARLHCPLAFFPQSDPMRFPTQELPPSGACSLPLGPSYIVAATAPRCSCIRFRKHLTHTSFLDAGVPLCAAQLHVTLEPWCTTTIILNHIGLTRRTGS